MDIFKEPIINQVVESFIEANVNAIFAVTDNPPYKVSGTSIRAERITNKELQEIIAADFLTLFPPAVSQKLESLLKKVKTSGEGKKIDLEYLDRQQQTLYVTFHMANLTVKETRFFLIQCCDKTANVLAKQKIEKMNIQLSKPTITDDLTDLHNHRYLKDRFSTEYKLSKLTGDVLSFILFDIDNFRDYNKNSGHENGNLALQEIAKVIKKYKKATDIAARYGGEELAIVCPGVELAGAIEVAEQICRGINRLDVVNAKLQPLGMMSASVGISMRHPGDRSETDMMVRADTAMYRAKKLGRNTIHTEVDLAQTTEDPEYQQELVLKNEIQQILDKKLF